MIESFISYNLDELENHQLLSEAKTLHKSKMINEVQYNKIREEVKSSLYTPSVFMKILLFILSFIGLSTVLAPVNLVFGNIGEIGFRIISVLTGLLLIWVTEKVLIDDKNHYKSGVTEALIYTGFAFLTFGILGFGDNIELSYLIVALLITVIITVRYLDLLALVAGFMLFISILYRTIHFFGGITESLMPFIFMIIFLLVFVTCMRIENSLKSFVFTNHLIIAKTLALVIIYGSVNYFVVREISVLLMGLVLRNGKDIPFAIIFYILTALMPILYIYYGIFKRSLLFLRVGLLVFALSVVTFKYYFSLGMPVITFTVSGIILITISLWMMNYLKIIRNGYTSENLINDKWLSEDINAIIISQTMGGNKLIENKNGTFGGGHSGGGGATTKW
ncbi:MAG: hypothetical protein PHT07_00730 [Paludibacter sp.]|nr:hypothetical protein [Paludibacter sp.]